MGFTLLSWILTFTGLLKGDLRVGICLPSAQKWASEYSSGKHKAGSNIIIRSTYYKWTYTLLKQRSWSVFPFMLAYFSFYPFPSMDVSLMAEGNTSKMN